ncbi:transcriptional attenuator, LytR family [Georgenia satyanarayanai]|uniref:Transcriptional attenuator, LytR family n=1 Tax=Georgenia satyanarayanai TaxID=860221 RepID=A0A2Y9ATA9_9MICO|nr:LCP family protein [Georgenia satyanarayanai]PYF95927.1 LytR family transcriptional attenuator [Georgenia satyanarayanai]SSA47296.1 transcriptional attenuator, LytR family [Georgenia satyanarayanai]
MSVRTPRHAASHRRPSRWARGAGLAALSVVLFGTSTLAIAYNDIQTNIDRHDIDDYLGERPTAAGEGEPAPLDPASGEDINIVVLGSDDRTGDVNSEYGTTPEAGQRSDTTMIVHISAERDRVEVVSIPRDSLVTIPSCRMGDGSWTEPRYETMFNKAFAMGADGGGPGAAAACTMRTIEELSGVLIDDFVIVDFAGFINVVDALGGVPMCIPDPIDDPKAKVQLEAGEQVLDGREALGFARARYTLTGGSDINRIGRQQELVAAIAREALSKNLLTDLPKLYRFLDAATSTLTTGTDLGSIPTMAGLAYSIREIDLENIVFETMPHLPAGNRVVPAPEAEELWAALRDDEPIQGALNAAGEEPTEEPSDEETGESEEPATDEPPVTADPEPTETPICP